MLIPNSTEREYGLFGVLHYDFSNKLLWEGGFVLIKKHLKQS